MGKARGGVAEKRGSGEAKKLDSDTRVAMSVHLHIIANGAKNQEAKLSLAGIRTLSDAAFEFLRDLRAFA
jgi:hypothetical protein